MTQQEFFLYTQLHPTQVNIWYDAGGPPYTLRAITIPALDYNTPPQDHSTFLENVQQITIPLSTGEGITLNVISVTQVQSPGTPVMPVTKYYYYNIVPVTISDIGNTGIAAGNLVFSPSLDTFSFADSSYNVLEGSIEASRKSNYIMLADRYKIGTLANPAYTGPLNIQELLTGSAAKADVQDSNYTLTGWVNGRYEGTKTDRIDYLSEPAISGKFFQGAEFPQGATMGQVNYLISSSQVVYKEYFFAGVGDTPGFVTNYSKYVVNGAYSTYDTVIQVKPENPNSNLNSFKLGDLINFEGSDEILRVNAVGIFSTSPLIYTLVVSRGYYGDAEPVNNNQLINKVTQVQVYNVTGNKLSGVPKGQLLVKETGVILRLDSLGFVVSST